MKLTSVLIVGRAANAEIQLRRCHVCKGRCSRTHRKRVRLTGFSMACFKTFAAQVYHAECAEDLMGQLLDAIGVAT